MNKPSTLQDRELSLNQNNHIRSFSLSVLNLSVPHICCRFHSAKDLRSLILLGFLRLSRCVVPVLVRHPSFSFPWLQLEDVALNTHPPALAGMEGLRQSHPSHAAAPARAALAVHGSVCRFWSHRNTVTYSISVTILFKIFMFVFTQPRNYGSDHGFLQGF